jgi:hypothetical protein
MENDYSSILYADPSKELESWQRGNLPVDFVDNIQPPMISRQQLNEKQLCFAAVIDQ